jgi:hypothetical protein
VAGRGRRRCVRYTLRPCHHLIALWAAVGDWAINIVGRATWSNIPMSLLKGCEAQASLQVSQPNPISPCPVPNLFLLHSVFIAWVLHSSKYYQ